MAILQAQAEDFGRRYTEAWCSHDSNAVASFYAEDGQLIINDGEPSVGRAGIAEAAQGFYDGFPDLVVKMDSVRAAGDYCIYMWSLEGTNAGEGGTGARVAVSGWEYWRFDDDGLVALSRGHFDEADYERQLAGG